MPLLSLQPARLPGSAKVALGTGWREAVVPFRWGELTDPIAGVCFAERREEEFLKCGVVWRD